MLPSSLLGIPMARGERGWSTFTDSLLSPKTCHFWVSSSLTPRMWGQTQLSAGALCYQHHCGMGWHCCAPSLHCTPHPNPGRCHPGYGACKWLFLRQGTSSRHRADVTGDKRDTYPVINPAGLAAPPLCLQCLLHRPMARSELVLLHEWW